MTDPYKFKEHLKCDADHYATGFYTPDGSNNGFTKREAMAKDIFCALINRLVGSDSVILREEEQYRLALTELANYSVAAAHILIKSLNEY